MVQKKKDIIRLLIVDDHPMVRDGIRQMLKSVAKGILLEISESDNGEMAINMIRNRDFNIVLMDFQLAETSGDRVIETMLLYKPSLKILTVSNYDQLAYIQRMMAAGARGYVLKNIEPSELLMAIKTILNNKIYYCNEVAIKLLDAPKLTISSFKKSNKYNLTGREIEVLRLIAEEKTNEEIAVKLFIAKRTVDTHRQSILNKVHARNTAGLIKVAYELNLI